MKTTNITEQNKLIAEFMGLKPYEDDRYGTMWPDPSRKNNPMVFGNKYHESWDWLMPAVERIRTHCIDTFKDTDKMGDIFRGIHVGNIQVTHKAVIQFITWYKENTQNIH